jgi:CubicO group peptidase (beta-lactamase class C family)
MNHYSRRTVLKGLATGTAALTLGDLGAGMAASAQAGPGLTLPRTNPETVGIDPAAVLAFVNAVEQKVGGLHSFMLLRRGQVAAEGWWAPYAPQLPHMLYSLSKSFCSTAVGLAVAEGRLTVDAPVISFFKEELPEKVSDHLAAMKVRHLLSMSTGHEKDATGPTTRTSDGNWVRAFLAQPVEREPGSLFVYNSAATYMCSAIVQKLTGMPILRYLRTRLFNPLGIEGATWESCPRGINTGGWGLAVKTEDIARFGQLYLQKGNWEGRPLVAETWVREATGKQVDNGSNPNSDWNQGYGYQFWRCRHNAFRGDGAFGQYCVVMPQQETVLAITSGVGDMQAVLNCAWDHLLPGMQGSTPSSAAAPALKSLLGDLAVPPPAGSPTSRQSRRLSGKTITFESNPEGLQSAVLTFQGGRCSMTLKTGGGERSLTCDNNGWVRGELPLPAPSVVPQAAPPLAKAAARGAWTSDDTYVVKVCFVETPYIQTQTWKFDGDRVTVTSALNIGFGPTNRPPLIGRVSSSA